MKIIVNVLFYFFSDCFIEFFTLSVRKKDAYKWNAEQKRKKIILPFNIAPN